MLTHLYNSLKKITETNDAFYSSIQEINGYSIESFSYRFVEANSFLDIEYASEMRGIAFIYGHEINTPKLFTAGYHKFFNYGEVNTIEEIRGKDIESIQDKIDWSLIMFGQLPDGKIIAKSKTSINSDVAVYANNILKSDKMFYNFIKKYLDLWIFPICEYVGPDNRIVLSYQTSELILLWMRKINGEYLSSSEVEQIRNNEIPHINISQTIPVTSLSTLLEKQKEEEGYEGYIVNYTDGYKMKIKLLSYIMKHNAKDSINNSKKLMEICLNNETDDLKSLFMDDPIAIDLIKEAEHKVFSYYNCIVAESNQLFEKYSLLFYQYNLTADINKKRAIRKEIVMQNKKNKYFGFLMKKLDNWKIDYKEFVRKNIII